jgi:hypothetical protein
MPGTSPGMTVGVGRSLYSQAPQHRPANAIRHRYRPLCDHPVAQRRTSRRSPWRPPKPSQMMKATPEQMKQGMDARMAWGDKFKGSIVEMGAPLGKTMKVDTNGMSSMKNDIIGYSIVEAESEDDAAEVFEDHPHLSMPGAHIEIVEFFPMPGM